MKTANPANPNTFLIWVFLLQAMLSGLAKAQVASENTNRKSSNAPEIKIPLNPGDAATNAPVLPPDSRGSLEELRTLLHLYSRLGQPKMVESVAARILSRDPRDKETLRLLVSFYLERKDGSRALKYSHALVKFYPEDAQAHFLLAMAFKLDGQNRLAKEVLMTLKSEKFQNRSFPYESELASAAWSSGDWLQAVRSYQEALENPNLQPEARNEARHQLEQLFRTHSPQLLAKETFTHFQSGLIFRSVAEASQPLAANHRLRLDLERDDLKLNRADLLRPQWVDRYDVLAGLESDYRQWRTKVFGGIGDKGGMYGAHLTRALGPDADLTLAVHGNQRATDSLLLEVLRGREDELSLALHAHLYPDILANLKLRGRRVLLGGETLGYVYSVDLNLERVILKSLPELHFGYRGLFTGYSQSSKNPGLVDSVALPGNSVADRLVLLKNLVTPINDHGLFLSWQQTINTAWSWHALAGSDYSVTRSSFGQTIEAGLSCFPSRNTELILSAGYSTSASTSEQDTKRLELSLAFRYRF